MEPLETNMMSSDQRLSLLGVPVGVEELIISFVASGEGGVKRILNLRQACKDTKSWIDNLPKQQAEIVFSRAQIKMKSDLQALIRFVSSPPPIGVTTLSLDTTDVYIKDSPDYEKAWTAFRDFWHSKLETLVLRNANLFKENQHHEYIKAEDIEVNWRLLQIMESPSLVKLQFLGNCCFEEVTKLPPCFQKIEEFHSNYIKSTDLQRDEFYSQLAINDNLRVLNLRLDGKEDFVGCAKLIHRRKDDIKLQVTLDCSFLDMYNGDDENFHRIFSDFEKSILASKSTIHLKFYMMGSSVGDLRRCLRYAYTCVWRAFIPPGMEMFQRHFYG